MLPTGTTTIPVVVRVAPIGGAVGDVITPRRGRSTGKTLCGGEERAQRAGDDAAQAAQAVVGAQGARGTTAVRAAGVAALGQERALELHRAERSSAAQQHRATRPRRGGDPVARDGDADGKQERIPPVLLVVAEHDRHAHDAVRARPDLHDSPVEHRVARDDVIREQLPDAPEPALGVERAVGRGESDGRALGVVEFGKKRRHLIGRAASLVVGVSSRGTRLLLVEEQTILRGRRLKVGGGVVGVVFQQHLDGILE
mmetsp:Transcript_4634/g.18876  ORF Transcript_4634/g.18876 Transcript_4634/m.18876 type:complete len:256 (+) Transcript_4634:1119-1886(+)